MKVTQYLKFLGTSEKVGSKIKDYTKSHFPIFFFISKHDNFLSWKKPVNDVSLLCYVFASGVKSSPSAISVK